MQIQKLKCKPWLRPLDQNCLNNHRQGQRSIQSYIYECLRYVPSRCKFVALSNFTVNSFFFTFWTEAPHLFPGIHILYSMLVSIEWQCFSELKCFLVLHGQLFLSRSSLENIGLFSFVVNAVVENLLLFFLMKIYIMAKTFLFEINTLTNTLRRSGDERLRLIKILAVTWNIAWKFNSPQNLCNNIQYERWYYCGAVFVFHCHFQLFG